MKSKKIAIYPGTFDPFHKGHLNICEKAEAIFGEGNVIIAVGVNPQKKTSEIDRPATIITNFPSKKVEKYSGFLTDYIWEKEKEGYDVTIIKGLRNGDDLDYEVNQLRFMEEMKPDIKVMFLVCDKQFEHISSSACRMLEAIRPGAAHKYLAKETENLPTTKMVAESLCQVFVNENESEKYIIINSSQSMSTNYAFEDTYEKCLIWIKEQEEKYGN